MIPRRTFPGSYPGSPRASPSYPPPKRRLGAYKSLPNGLLVYPGHDYEGWSHSILGEEKKDNPKMLYASEEEFVEFMDLENPKHLDPVSRLADALKSNMA